MKDLFIKHLSAWIPIAMSLSALIFTISYIAIFGISNPAPKDEGTAAHIFQLLIGGQLPIIAFFAVRWLPKKPKETFQILVLQFIAGVLAFAPVYLLEL